jgi:hypothetical protein
MQRFITDLFVRRIGQGILLAIFVAIIALCVTADIYMIARQRGALNDDGMPGALAFFDILSRPFTDTLAPLAVIMTALIPVMFAVVCYKIVLGAPEAPGVPATPPRAGEELNAVGHAAFVLTLLGVLTGGFTLVLFTIWPETLEALAGSVENRTAVQGLISAAVSFHVLYFTQLLGLKPK